jgi:hypothetical protein
VDPPEQVVSDLGGGVIRPRADVRATGVVTPSVYPVDLLGTVETFAMTMGDSVTDKSVEVLEGYLLRPGALVRNAKPIVRMSEIASGITVRALVGGSLLLLDFQNHQVPRCHTSHRAEGR